jgi:hypothetical protein
MIQRIVAGGKLRRYTSPGSHLISHANAAEQNCPIGARFQIDAVICVPTRSPVCPAMNPVRFWSADELFRQFKSNVNRRLFLPGTMNHLTPPVYSRPVQ